MPQYRYREEVINSMLAELLRKHGLKAEPETTKTKTFPDVMISIEGIKVNLEGKFRGSPGANNLLSYCEERIKKDIADIGVAVWYPKNLEMAESLDHLRGNIEKAFFRCSILYHSSRGLETIDKGSINIQHFVENLRNVLYVVVRNDILKSMIGKVENSIKEATDLGREKSLFFNSETLIERIKKTLGIKKERNDEERSDEEE